MLCVHRFCCALVDFNQVGGPTARVRACVRASARACARACVLEKAHLCDSLTMANAEKARHVKRTSTQESTCARRTAPCR
eukprot:3157129-Pleurochrysis_carterae.AAC.1